MARHTRSAASSDFVRVVRYWCLFDSGARQLTCELCRTQDALELRCGVDVARPTRSERIPDATGALALAEQWKAEYLEDDTWYRESPLVDDGAHTPGVTVLERRARKQAGHG